VGLKPAVDVSNFGVSTASQDGDCHRASCFINTAAAENPDAKFQALV
jgi:hypothetical protein